MKDFDTKNPPGRENEIKRLEDFISQNKRIILLGPRRVGKTTLLNAIKARKNEIYKVIFYDCEVYRSINHFFAWLYANSKKLKIFVSSVGTQQKGELKRERSLCKKILKDSYNPFLIENHAEPYPPEEVEENEIKDSDVFLIIIGKKGSKNVEKEFNFAVDYKVPILCLIKGSSKVDTKRDKISQDIIKKIKNINKEKGGLCTYKRYSSITDFGKTLKESVKKLKEDWIKYVIEEKYKKEEFRKIGDKFFKTIAESDKPFLILVDELGELRKDKNNNFDDFLAYFKGKCKEIEDVQCSVILTGSENVFTSGPQKSFSDFEIVRVDPFKKDIAKNVLKEIIGKDLDDSMLEEIIKLCGTLPADIKIFSDRFKETIKETKKEKWKEVIAKVIEDIINEKGNITKNLFFENLSEDAKIFLKNVIPHLPATRLEMQTLFPSEKFENVLEETTQKFMILKDENMKYDVISNLLKLAVIKEQDPTLFNKILYSNENNLR